MKLSEISIQRPVLATVMSMVIVLLGAISYTLLPVREYPDIDPPIVSVTTLYRGASANVVETEITDVLEEQFATLAAVKTMASSSKEQGSVITIEFELGRDVNEAANDVRDRVARGRGKLPREVDDPIVAKVDADASPVVWLALSSGRHDGLELSDIAENLLKDRIQRLAGVGSVLIGGERRYAMRVWLDPLRMAAHGLTTGDVETAIRMENAEIPAGRVEGDAREFAVRTRGGLSTPEEFGAIIISQRGNDRVRLRDIAEVTVGAEDERSVARYNGEPAVGLGIIKLSKASTLEVATAVRASLGELEEGLPDGVKLEVAYDSSVFISNSIREVSRTLLTAMCLVVFVVLVFLKSGRATFIPTIAIPISIIGTFTAAYFLGYTINVLTLLALVLSIGLVVDDAIVVLENIHRHMEMGKRRRRAAIDGTREIGFAVIATTVALVAVFIPVAFLTGRAGRLFHEFGICIAVAVTISTFVALSLTPMVCSRVLKPSHDSGARWATRSFDAFFFSLHQTYRRILVDTLNHRALVIGSAILLVGLSSAFFLQLPRELVPIEDRGFGFGIVIAPEGATLGYTDRYMRDVEQRLMTLPERKALFTATGLAMSGPGQVTNGVLFLALKPRDAREKSQQQIVEELFPQMMSIPGVLAFVINPPSLGGRFSSSPVEYILQADTYDKLGDAVQKLMAKASELGYLVSLDTDLRLNKPQLEVTIDRERAAELGVSVSDIGATLETLLGGRVVSDYKRGTAQHDVIAQMKAVQRAEPNVIEGIYIRGNGQLVQLANVVSVAETVSPKELNHFNRVRSARITSTLPPGVGIGTALDALDGIVKSELPPDIRRELGGLSQEFRSSSTILAFMFVFALVFIFLVLSAQFESFVHPLTILFSVPLAVFGALLSLFVFKQSLNVYSQIGFIMLIGLVTKNSILIVEFSNQLRARGRAVVEAVVEASTIRLRPILMTSFATIFGVLPIALGLGAGGESRRPLGIVVVGGLLFSTFLTLLLVPVVYTLLAQFTRASRPDDEGPETSVDTSMEGASAS